MAHSANDRAARIGRHYFTLADHAGRFHWRLVQRLSRRWRRLYPHALIGLHSWNSHTSRCRNRSFRDRDLGQLWHLQSRHQRQCRHSHCIGNAHRSGPRRAARCNLDAVFRRPQNPPRFRALAAHWRGHRRLHTLHRSQAMKFLICSDGTEASDNATKIAALIGKPALAQITLLGIAENSADEEPLRQRLEKQADLLRQNGGTAPKIFARAGDPVTQIVAETTVNKYELVIVGARLKRISGPFWQSQRTYEVIKSIEPPVLVAIGNCDRVARVLLCSGGKRYIDAGVR